MADARQAGFLRSRRLQKFAKNIRKRLGRGLAGEDGSALVELAMTMSFLGIPLLLGTGQIALLVYDSIEVSNAALAGASYGMQSLTFAANTAGVTTAAQGEASDLGGSMTVTPTTYYACSTSLDGTRYTGSNAQADATSACTGSTNRPLEFIQVQTSMLITSAIHCPGLPTTYALKGLSIMEVEQ